MSSWHRHCRGHSIGRVLHFLYHYCGFDVAEHAQIGASKVIYHGKTIATYEFLSDTDIPYFTFQPYLSYGGEDLAKTWEKNQKERVFEAIRDGAPAEPKKCDDCRRLKLRLDMQQDLCDKFHVSKSEVIIK